MDKFAADVQSFHWWLSAVAVGILINLISGYLKGPVDALGGQLMKPIGRLSMRRQAVLLAMVAELKRHPASIGPALHHATHRYIQSVGYHIAALAQFWLGSQVAAGAWSSPGWFPKMAFAVIMVFAVVCEAQAMRLYADGARSRNAALVAAGLLTLPSSPNRET
jgi:hypothetical protein